MMPGSREPLIARLARARARRRDLRGRPRYPGVRRASEAAALVLAAVAFLDLYSAHVGFLSSVGLQYFVLVVFVTLWAGLPGGLAGCAVLAAHVWLAYRLPIAPYGPLVSLYGRKPPDATQDVSVTWTIFPVYAGLMALVHLALFRGSLRAYDAQASAAAEASGRQAAETDLRSSERLRRLIVDSSTDAVVVATDGLITHWNPNAQALFGWTPEEALGRRLTETILPPRLVGPHLQKVLESSREPFQGETRAGARDEDALDVEVSMVPHRQEDGTVLIGFFRDISERKRAEMGIREQNATLEERVAERTAQYEAANAELTGFNYSVSHDLRTPLRGIVANARILVEDAPEGLAPESLERLRRVESAALKMDRLIESLLQFSRVGQAAIKAQDVDLSAAMTEIVEELCAHRPGSAAIEPGLHAKGDPELLFLVARNLLENAWKYVALGEAPRVEVGRTPEGAFFVRDGGIGFDMAYVDKIWKPFERLHRDEDYPGTGIGLANCRRIVRRHGGEMWAESKVGKGTTVYFTLPDLR